MNIFEKFSIVIIPVLLTALLGSIITRKIKERQGFVDAAVEFRKVFNQVLVDIQSGRYGFGTPVSDDIIKTHCVVYLNFRHYLHGACRRQYDEAWNQYCHDCKNVGHRGRLTRITRVDIEKDIKSLLEFTEYGWLRNMLFFWKRLWFGLRLKVLGPDKATKELVEKFIKAYQDDEKPLS